MMVVGLWPKTHTAQCSAVIDALRRGVFIGRCRLIMVSIKLGEVHSAPLIFYTAQRIIINRL